MKNKTRKTKTEEFFGLDFYLHTYPSMNKE